MSTCELLREIRAETSERRFTRVVRARTHTLLLSVHIYVCMQRARRRSYEDSRAAEYKLLRRRNSILFEITKTCQDIAWEDAERRLAGTVQQQQVERARGRVICYRETPAVLLALPSSGIGS